MDKNWQTVWMDGLTFIDMEGSPYSWHINFNKSKGIGGQDMRFECLSYSNSYIHADFNSTLHPNLALVAHGPLTLDPSQAVVG